MSNKGKTFTYDDLPQVTRQRLKNKQVVGMELYHLDKWLHDQTERNRIVAMDGDTPLIAEELQERAMRHFAREAGTGEIDSAVLAALRGLMTLTEEQRDAVLGSFQAGSTDLVMPFDPPKNSKAGKPKK